MIEFFIIIIMYTDGDFQASLTFKTLEECELTAKLKEYHRLSFEDSFICKKVSIDISKPSTK